MLLPVIRLVGNGTVWKHPMATYGDSKVVTIWAFSKDSLLDAKVISIVTGNCGHLAYENQLQSSYGYYGLSAASQTTTNTHCVAYEDEWFSCIEVESTYWDGAHCAT